MSVLMRTHHKERFRNYEDEDEFKGLSKSTSALFSNSMSESTKSQAMSTSTSTEI